MKNTDILIIGAGAAGLMAAYTLSKAGKKVVVLEARDRIGGRIHTLHKESPLKFAELGAEFVHGNLPVTVQILKEAGLECTSAGGEFWNYDKGKFIRNHEFIHGWDELMQKLSKLEEDTSIGNFLLQEFGGDQYVALRKSVTNFVSGYDTADPFRASAFALRKEWGEEDDHAQHRITKGYDKILDHLADESRKSGAEIIINTLVKDIYRQGWSVKAVSEDRTVYHAEKAIIALPLGVLRSANDTASAIAFHPALPDYIEAIGHIGFGAIVKILLEFNEAFWESETIAKLAGYSLSKMGFIVSDEEIPTWWTQYPDRSTLLTGWLGGLPAERKKHLSDEELLDQGLMSLSNIFNIHMDELKKGLVASKVVNWTIDPFTLGSYTYDTVESHKARKILAKPIDNTIYFAGEYLYEGPAMGTVEAALSSGLETAQKLIG